MTRQLATRLDRTFRPLHPILSRSIVHQRIQDITS